MEKCLDHFSLSYKVLGRGIKNWKMTYKMDLAIEFLKTVETPWVLGLDGFDVLLFESPDLILERFKSMNKRMLFNAECEFWPSGKLMNDYMKQLKTYQDGLCTTSPRYLNAGCYLGERDACLQFTSFARSLTATKDMDPKLKDTEQWRFHVAFMEFDDVSLDYRSEIFQNLVYAGEEIHINPIKL